MMQTNAAASDLGTPTPDFVHYLPLLTTAICIAFLAVLIRRMVMRNWAPHLVWWGIGVFFYGLGTAIESTITLAGNTAGLTKAWYIAGAILGGYPLATGSVYLLANRKLAHWLTAVSGVAVVTATVLVLLSPMNEAALEAHRPSGAVLEWQWVRLTTPFINLYAAVFLIGGALYSTAKFLTKAGGGMRALGTTLIAVGGILPGIGGGMAKAGIVEALYIGECGGIILIWAGYEFCIRGRMPVARRDELSGGGAGDPSEMGLRPV